MVMYCNYIVILENIGKGCSCSGVLPGDPLVPLLCYFAVAYVVLESEGQRYVRCM
jgi:hypothetical protein